MPSTTAVRITTISAAQNKRGKDCFEGGMEQGCFTWFKDMGGNSNWMYIKVVNVSSQHVSLALWLLYEASTEPLVDPLTGAGSIQVGFFNQSKNLNRQVPLFELAEESKPGLEIGPGQSTTLKVRINDLSSHHQNQRFIIVIGPGDAPIRGSRSVPIEIMSKPRVEATPTTESGNAASVLDSNKRKATAAPLSDSYGLQQSQLLKPNSTATDALLLASGQVGGPPLKRQLTETNALTSDSVIVSKAMLNALLALTEPDPKRDRKLELILNLLSGLPDDEQREIHHRLAEKLYGPRSDQQTLNKKTIPSTTTHTTTTTSLNKPTEEKNSTEIEKSSVMKPLSPATASIAAAMRAAAEKELARTGEQPSQPRRFQPLVQAIMAFQQNAKRGTAQQQPQPDAPAWVNSVLEKFPVDDSLDFTEEQLSSFFVTDDPAATNFISSPNTAGGPILDRPSTPPSDA